MRRERGGVEVSDARKLRALDDENRMPNKLLAESMRRRFARLPAAGGTRPASGSSAPRWQQEW
jgi:hypothetical protein